MYIIFKSVEAKEQGSSGSRQAIYYRQCFGFFPFLSSSAELLCGWFPRALFTMDAWLEFFQLLQEISVPLQKYLYQTDLEPYGRS